MSKRTPGPWVYEPPYVRELIGREGGHLIATMNTVAPREADGRLMAAAPDLLRACREYIDALTVGARIVSGHGVRSVAFAANVDQQCAALEAMKAAVAKAEGTP